MDTSLMTVVPNEFTASFFATTDRVNAQIASFYPGAMGHASTQSLKELASKPDHVSDVLNDGAKRARFIAQQTMVEVREAMQLP